MDILDNIHFNSCAWNTTRSSKPWPPRPASAAIPRAQTPPARSDISANNRTILKYLTKNDYNPFLCAPRRGQFLYTVEV